MDQRFLARARAVTLLRDERKGRLMIRFLAMGPDLEVRSGTLGQEQGHGTGAMNILKATENVLLRACTIFATPPYRCRAQPVLNRKIYRHLRLAVTGITTDAAADEVLGAELMRSPELLSQTRALCPNLQHVLRDKTHASRRLSSRPYGADPYLSDVLLMFATGRTSPARMVQHSMEARRVFRGFVHTSTHPEVKKGSHKLAGSRASVRVVTEAIGAACPAFAQLDQNCLAPDRAWQQGPERPGREVAWVARHGEVPASSHDG